MHHHECVKSTRGFCTLTASPTSRGQPAFLGAIACNRPPWLRIAMLGACKSPFHRDGIVLCEWWFSSSAWCFIDELRPDDSSQCNLSAPLWNRWALDVYWLRMWRRAWRSSFGHTRRWFSSFILPQYVGSTQCASVVCPLRDQFEIFAPSERLRMFVLPFYVPGKGYSFLRGRQSRSRSSELS